MTNIPTTNDADAAAFINRIMAGVQARKVAEGQPTVAMCPEITIMSDLIGNMAFGMMGARNLTFDNATYRLQWRMGAGAWCDTVVFSYDDSKDLYTLRFITYSKVDGGEIVRDILLENVYCDDVKTIIERQTGFYLSL